MSTVHDEWEREIAFKRSGGARRASKLLKDLAPDLTFSQLTELMRAEVRTVVANIRRQQRSGLPDRDGMIHGCGCGDAYCIQL